MAIEDIQTNLRLPSNLKEQLQASADQAGRSLSAEAAHRLALSYELETVVADLRGALGSLQSQHQTVLNSVDTLRANLRVRERDIATLQERLAVAVAERKERENAAASMALIEQSVAAAIAAVDSYDMRIEIAKSRLDSLDVRRRLILSESGVLNHQAKTDEEFEKLAEAITHLRAVETEIKHIGRDLDVLQRDRAATFQQIERMSRDLEKARRAAEDLKAAAGALGEQPAEETLLARVSRRLEDAQSTRLRDSASGINTGASTSMDSESVPLLNPPKRRMFLKGSKK